MSIIIILMVFITVFTAVLGVYYFMLANKRAINRLDRYVNVEQSVQEEEKQSFKGITKNIVASGVKLGEMGIFKGYRKAVQVQLVKAHLPLKGEEFITICIAAGLGSILLFSALYRNIFIGLIMGLVGWNIPMIIVKIRKKKRVKMMNDQLGDALALISNSLKAGYSFLQAVDTVSTEMSGCISEEFGQLKKEINLGSTTENALENLLKRVESDDLGLMVTAVLIQRQIGGNLSEILDNISDTIRERVKLQGEVKALTAHGRMSGIIIAILPPAMGLIMGLVNPEHMSYLFNNKIGLAMVVGSALMELTGMYFISKIVKIQV